jgi:hypothetical protein
MAYSGLFKLSEKGISELCRMCRQGDIYRVSECRKIAQIPAASLDWLIILGGAIGLLSSSIVSDL